LELVVDRMISGVGHRQSLVFLQPVVVAERNSLINLGSGVAPVVVAPITVHRVVVALPAREIMVAPQLMDHTVVVVVVRANLVTPMGRPEVAMENFQTLRALLATTREVEVPGIGRAPGKLEETGRVEPADLAAAATPEASSTLQIDPAWMAQQTPVVVARVSTLTIKTVV
jgi:hypothetical protein